MSTTTDGELLNLWQFESRSRLSDAALAEYTRYLRRLTARTGRPLRDLGELDLKLFLADEGQRLAPGSLQVIRRALRCFYAWLAANNLIDVNPASAIPAIRAPEVPVRVAGGDVRDAVVAGCLTVRDRALLEVIFGTGCRRGEVLGLRVGDVSVERRTVHVRKSKSGKPRTAPLDPRATAALADWLLERARSGVEAEALWVKPDGSALTADGLKTVIRRVAARSGVTFSSHDARRAYATRWLEVGGSTVGLEAVCGWAPGSPMVARYTRMDRERLALDEASRLFG